MLVQQMTNIQHFLSKLQNIKNCNYYIHNTHTHTLHNLHIPSPPPNINITVYADDITMTSTDTNKQIAQAKLQPYLQEIASWTQQNQLHLNPDKTTSTLFTPDPAEYSTQLTLNIDNVVIPTVKHLKY